VSRITIYPPHLFRNLKSESFYRVETHSDSVLTA